MAKWIVAYRDDISADEFASNPRKLYSYTVAGHFNKWSEVVKYMDRHGTKHDHWKVSKEEK